MDRRSDAEAWSRLGRIAWALVIRADTTPKLRGLNAQSLWTTANDALRTAASLEPASARYQLDAGLFLRLSPTGPSRLAAQSYLNAAVAALPNVSDSSTRATIAIEAGRVFWLRYDSEARRIAALACPDLPQSLDSARVIRRTPRDDQNVMYLPVEDALTRFHNALADCPQQPPSDAGLANYEQAEQLFRLAYDATPNDDRVLRHIATLLADRNRWRELAALARDRTNRTPSAPAPWLALALALHRAGESSVATAIFDTAVARMEPRERGRLFAFSRLLRRPDSVAFSKASADERADWERSFWQMADPLWSRPGHDPRTEFLARVTYAEMRWTVDELGVRGADSDRGEMFIRFGPPDRVVLLSGCNSSDCSRRAACTSSELVALPNGVRPIDDGMGNTTPNPHCRTAVRDIRTGVPMTTFDDLQSALPGVSDVVTLWDYYSTGLTLAFWGAPGYGTARFPRDDAKHIDRVVEIRPTAFDNLASERIVPMPLSVARFRARSDSVDIVTFAQPPVRALREIASNAPIRVHSWLLEGGDAENYHDSATLGAAGIERAIYRVPASTYLYRVEATAAGVVAAGRGTRWIVAERDTVTGFATRGFGMSDVLLASAARSSKPAPQRWSDFAIAPVFNTIPQRGMLELIWEMYELGSRDGQAQYTVSVTIQPQRSIAGRIGAALARFAEGVVGVNRRGDRVTYTFDRAVPAARDAVVDNVSLALRDTPPGDYRLVIEITDRTNRRRTSRVVSFAIAPAQ
ncbi:MAG TPA: GWxTD domain-containing protein [Gemmatimonadaceae bacterium]|nr:GWxTD domain-containing protein [Gemmatimonadaceae bacterium]